jgi:hypothetical protein
MASYAVRNVTTGKTSGTFATVEAAQNALPDHVRLDDEWQICELSDDGDAGRDVLSGRGLVGG